MALGNLMMRSAVAVDPAPGGIPDFYRIEPPGQSSFTNTVGYGFLNQNNLYNTMNSTGTMPSLLFKSTNPADSELYRIEGIIYVISGFGDLTPASVRLYISGEFSAPPDDCWNSATVTENGTGNGTNFTLLRSNTTSSTFTADDGREVREWLDPISGTATGSFQNPFTTDGVPNGPMTNRTDLTFNS